MATKKPTFLTLLRLLERRVQNQQPTPGEQRAIIGVIPTLLQACGKSVERPLPGRDLQEVRGLPHVKRALEVAAAGGHHLLLSGPHQAGKSLVARTLPSLLPVTAVPYPFRAPDAFIPYATFVGEPDAPGELTLAHGGVLFLKDVHAFDQMKQAALRKTMETRVVAFSEEEASLLFPANFLLVATTIPCPCGFFGDPVRECACEAEAILQHQQRVSAVVDVCFDIHVEVPRVREDLLSHYQEESSTQVQSRVTKARGIGQRRYADAAHLWVNADLRSVDEIEQYCQMDASAEKLLHAVQQQLHPTPSGILRRLTVARTIADLAGVEQILANHLAEAIQYRPKLG